MSGHAEVKVRQCQVSGQGKLPTEMRTGTERGKDSFQKSNILNKIVLAVGLLVQSLQLRAPRGVRRPTRPLRLKNETTSQKKV